MKHGQNFKLIPGRKRETFDAHARNWAKLGGFESELNDEDKLED
jgi:hypothetical protein